MTDHELADLKRDAERYRSLERHAQYGITTRNGGRGSYLLYIHALIGCEAPPIECSDFAECVDKLVRNDAKKCPTLPPPRDRQETLVDFKSLRGRD